MKEIKVELKKIAGLIESDVNVDWKMVDLLMYTMKNHIDGNTTLSKKLDKSFTKLLEKTKNRDDFEDRKFIKSYILFRDLSYTLKNNTEALLRQISKLSNELNL